VFEKCSPEAEEVLDLLVISVGCDVRDLNNIGRHIDCWFTCVGLRVSDSAECLG
jgi:hypothetical protein